MSLVSIFHFSIMLLKLDWNIAIPVQHAWRNQMLEHFTILFDIAEYFKPSLLGEEGASFEASNVSTSEETSVPTIETLWQAYVCSGVHRI